MRKSLMVLSGLFLLLLTGVANATLMSYSFSGYLTTVERPEGWDTSMLGRSWSKVSVEDYFFGIFSYETSLDFYEIGGSSLSITFIHNDQSMTSIPNLYQTQGYMNEADTFDSFKIARYYTGGSSLNEWGAVFESTDGSSLNSLIIPETLDLENWDIAYFFMRGDANAGPGHRFYFEGDIQNLQLTPEPASILLFGFGLLAIARVSRGKN